MFKNVFETDVSGCLDKSLKSLHKIPLLSMMVIMTMLKRNLLKNFHIYSNSFCSEMSSKKIQLLATCGTLRDDDNSGAPWTKDFIRVHTCYIENIDR